MKSNASGDAPAGGRHREAARNDTALLDAARLVFAVHGADAPVSMIAAHAGTGIGSLYRRYPNKEALLQYLCQAAVAQAIELAQKALADPDPWSGFVDLVTAAIEQRSGAFIPIGGTIRTTDEMNKTFLHNQRLLTEVVARAQTSGDLRNDINAIDVRLLLEQFSRRPPHDDTFRRGLRIAIDGLRAGTHNSTLAGPQPSWHDYLRRWNTTNSDTTDTSGRSASVPCDEPS